MSIALLELGASALGDLTSEVVFTGGATIGLDGVYAGLPPDDASQARAEEIVLPRLAAIAAAD